MGADWRSLTWHEYQMRLWAWNEGHDPTPPEPDYERLKRAMRMH